jgi:hypothetical protein
MRGVSGAAVMPLARYSLTESTKGGAVRRGGRCKAAMFEKCGRAIRATAMKILVPPCSRARRDLTEQVSSDTLRAESYNSFFKKSIARGYAGPRLRTADVEHAVNTACLMFRSPRGKIVQRQSHIWATRLNTGYVGSCSWLADLALKRRATMVTHQGDSLISRSPVSSLFTLPALQRAGVVPFVREMGSLRCHNRRLLRLRFGGGLLSVRGRPHLAKQSNPRVVIAGLTTILPRHRFRSRGALKCLGFASRSPQAKGSAVRSLGGFMCR